MADSPDDYDLGNTDVDLKQPDGIPVDAAASAVTSPDRPRNPDGTFAKVTPETPEVSPPVPSAKEGALSPKHPAYLVQAAQEFGLDEDEIEGMSTAVLGKTLWKLNQRVMQIQREDTRQRTFQEAQVKTPAPEPAVDEFALEIDEDVHPSLRAALLKVNDRTRKMKQLEDRLAQYEQRDQQREEATNAERIDSAFAALDASYKPFFGEGTGQELTGTPELERRIAILQAAKLTAADMRSQRALAAKIKAAAERLYSPAVKPPVDPYEAATPKNGKRITEEQWDQGGVARPTQRSGAAEPKGDALAVRNLTRKLKEIEQQTPDSEVADGLL